MESIKGRVAVITGANSGIGRGAALEFAKAGANVALIARRRAELEAVAKECEALGVKAIATPADVAKRAEVDAAIEAAVKAFGRVDVLVAAAGINVPKRSFAVSTPEDWASIMEINVLGCYNSTQACYGPMKANGGGLMVLIGSVAAKRVNPISGVAYSASKHALIGMANCILAEEAANNIRVTLIHPGVVNTPILDRRAQPPGAAERALMIQPEDIGSMCVFLAQLPARCAVPEIYVLPTAPVN